MAQLANTSDVYDIRNTEEAETVEDIIQRLDPMDTWAFSSARRKKVSGVKHEWLYEKLADATVVAFPEGAEASYTEFSPATRVSNETMIFHKTIRVSNTLEAVDKYGSKSTKARAMVIKGLEMKRDIEKAFWGTQAHTAGAAAGSARVSAGMASMIYYNVVKCGGATGSVPGYANGVWGAVIDGTTDGSLDEADLQSALQLSWAQGGNAELIVCGAQAKRRVAAFVGAAAYQGFQTNQGRVQGAIISAVDVYVSDYGSHKVTLNRYVPTDRVFCIDPDYISLGFLRPITKKPMAVTGDAESELMVAEFVPVCDNPYAHAQLIDISYS